MVPQTAIALLLFALLVVPGVIFELLRQTQRPAYEQTSLEELARVLLGSVAALAGSVTLVTVATLVFTDIVVDVAVLAREGPGWYWIHHPGIVTSSVLLTMGIAILLVLVTHRALNTPQGKVPSLLASAAGILGHRPGHTIERFHLWRTVLREYQPDGADTQVTVVKPDGTLIMGLLAGYDTSPTSDRGLALATPVVIQRPGQEPTKLEKPWEVLMIPARDISELAVMWPKQPSSDSTVNKGRGRKGPTRG